jgi:hypothetical protein
MCHETFHLEHTVCTTFTLERVVVVEKSRRSTKLQRYLPNSRSRFEPVRPSTPQLGLYTVQEDPRATGGGRNASACSLDGHLALFVRAEEPATIIFLLQGDDEVDCPRIAEANTSTRDAANTRDKLLRSRVLRHGSFRVSARLTFDSKEGQTWQQDSPPSLCLLSSLAPSLGIQISLGLSTTIFRRALLLLPVITHLPSKHMDAASAVALVR